MQTILIVGGVPAEPGEFPNLVSYNSWKIFQNVDKMKWFSLIDYIALQKHSSLRWLFNCTKFCLNSGSLFIWVKFKLIYILRTIHNIKCISFQVFHRRNKRI